MINNPEQANAPNATTRAAATWLARLCADDVTPAQAEKCRAWLAASPRHRQAFDKARHLAGQLDNLGDAIAGQTGGLPPALAATLADSAALAAGRAAKPAFGRKTGWYWALAASLLVAVSSALLWPVVGQQGPPAPVPKLYRTAIGSTNTFMLADGSTMTLNTNSSAVVAITPSDRRVHIKQGEVYFNVARDPQRPFTVVVGNGTVRAVGTAFNIRHWGDKVLVTVTEGRVAIKPAVVDTTPSAHGLPRGAVYGVGEQITFSDKIDRVNHLDASALKRALSWQSGRLVFQQATLEEIVQEVQRYLPQRIVIADDSIAGITGGGVFRTDNARSLLTAIERSMPVRVIRRGDVIILARQ